MGSKTLKKNNPTSIEKQQEVNDIVQDFKPTPGMILWLNTQLETRSDSPTYISKKSGLSKTNWYDWLKKDGFEDWYYKAYEEKTRRWRPYLDAIGLKKARNEFKYWDRMQDIAGRQEDKQEVQINNLIKIE